MARVSLCVGGAESEREVQFLSNEIEKKKKEKKRRGVRIYELGNDFYFHT